MKILDSIDIIREIDKKNILEMVGSMPKYFEDALKIDIQSNFNLTNYDGVIIFGMGGSGIVGDFVKSLITNYPVISVKSYEFSEFLKKGKYFKIFVSYSGNTIETLNIFNYFSKKSRKDILAITSGGMLIKTAENARVETIKIRKDLMPRFALPYMLIPILKIFSENYLFKINDIKNTICVLKDMRNKLCMEKNTSSNIAKSVAVKIGKKIPLLFTTNKFDVIAYRTKTQFNENAKKLAFIEIIPEMNHNTMATILNPLQFDNFFSIFIRDEKEDYITEIAFEMLKERIDHNNIVTLKATGYSISEKIFSLIYILDHITVYTAVLNMFDPSEIKMIEEFKERVRKKLKFVV